MTVQNREVHQPESPTTSDRPVENPTLMIFPRRWLDVYGRKLDEVWEAALRAFLGLVLLHPGISQVRSIH